MTAAAPRVRSPAARLGARALALAVDPALSAEVAVTSVTGLVQGSASAPEGALVRSRWRQFERPSVVADAAARLLREVLGHAGTGKDDGLGHRLERLVVRP